MTRDPQSDRAAASSASRWIIVLCLLLGWFNWGIEDLRLGKVPDIKNHPLLVLSPPWWPLRAYVSRSGDEQLYFEDSRLALGEAADLHYLASKRQGSIADETRALEARVRPGSGMRLPYRDFPFEYPPVPLLAMVIPRVFAAGLAGYRLAYGLLAALLVLAASFVGARLSDCLGVRAPDRPWRRMALFVLATGPILVSRIDALPALLVAAALLFHVRGRALVAGLLVGVGFLTKLYPLLVAAPWMGILWGERRWRDLGRLFAGIAIATALVATPFLLTSPGPFLASTFAYGARPFQIEGLVGALAVLALGKATIVGSFGSINVTTPGWLGPLWSVLLPVGIGACSLAAARQARKDPARTPDESAERLLAWTVAAIAVVLVTSKVLSPQYIIWLLPVAALARDKGRFRLALAAAGLTQLFYPILYDLFAEDGSRAVALIVTCRNVVLVALAALSARAAMGIARGEPETVS